MGTSGQSSGYKQLYIKKSIICGKSSMRITEKNATNKMTFIHRLMLRFMRMKAESIPDANARGNDIKKDRNAKINPKTDLGAADAGSRSSQSDPLPPSLSKKDCMRLSAAERIDGEADMLFTTALSLSKSAML